MGKPDISRIATSECVNILDSIQNDLDLWLKENPLLSKLHEDVEDLITQRNVEKQKGFNNTFCDLCETKFNLLLVRKILCSNCHFYICRKCSSWDINSKQWLCNLCNKKRYLEKETYAWICNRIKNTFSHFDTAKVLHNFCRKRRISDSENDSGYGTTNDFMPLLKLINSSFNQETKMADLSSPAEEFEDEDIADEEELEEIQHSIEIIIEGLLGANLDDATMDVLYPNSPLYANIFIEYHVQLYEAIHNLSKALQNALHNRPAINGNTPTTAHSALKSVIIALVQECEDLPCLELDNTEEIIIGSKSSIDFGEIFSSYESLVATAVINKVIEENQTKFKTNDLSSMQSNKIDGELENKILVEEVHSKATNHQTYETSLHSDINSFGLPVECVQIEEVEEITQEFTDSEDDKLSSISKWSSSLQSIDEINVPKFSEVDLAADSDNEARIPFPEFGCDLIDYSEKNDYDATCYLTYTNSWEDNWLFRKKKWLPLYRNLKYQLLAYCDQTPLMLIPCPSENSEACELDDCSSELSETHSIGSLEFSSDTDGTVPEIEKLSASLSKSTKKESSPLSSVSLEKDLSDEYTKEVSCQEEVVLPPIKDKTILKPTVNETKISNTEISQTLLKHPVDENNSNETLPFPGIIAEREHKKWLNAVPLKNNPYSAENISKRSDYVKKNILKEPISSFEEFEKKLSLSSANSESCLRKVDCGPKSINSELYKRDYYVNSDYASHYNDGYPLQKSRSLLCISPSNDDFFDVLSEEALNSFEEKVYVSSGKVFTLENHVKRLERELKDSSLHNEVSNNLSFFKQDTMQTVKECTKSKSQDTNTESDNGSSPLPSVKCLATKFTSNSSKEIKNNVNKSTNSPKQEGEKMKKSRPCMKVHSLTARSLSREFRDLAKQNLPKPMNRTIPMPFQSADDTTSERESLCSPESAPSSCSANNPDNAHGYTSDESSTSTNSIPRSKARRHLSRSILERATYWERRAEQGLLSDASVNEEFPAIDITPE